LAAAVATVEVAELAESLAEVAESSARLALVAAMALVMTAVEMAVMAVVAVVAGLLAMVGQQEGRVELLVTAVTTVVGAGEEILWEQAEERSPRGARKQGQSKVNHHCCRRPDSS